MNTEVNMANFIEAKSDQLTADDLMGGPRTITITRVTGNEGNAEQPVNIYFEGDEGRPYRPCKIMRRVMVAVWKEQTKNYIGRSMTLFRDPKVKWGGMEVGGIRISHMTGLESERTLAIQETRGAKKPYKVWPLKDVPKSNGASDDLGAWAHKFIASIARVPDAAKLDAGVAKVQDKIDALAEQIPDAHAAVTKAIEDKRAAFVADDEADPFTEAEPASWQPFVAGITARIAAATTEAELDEIKADIAKADHVPEAEGDKLIVLEARKRREIGKA